MGSTFISINDNGFWVRDGIIELWLRLAALHIEEPGDNMSHEDTNIVYDARNKWLLASMGYFSGCVPDYIDEISRTKTGKELILKTCRKLMDNLRRSSPALNMDMINLLGSEGVQTHDLETWRMIEIGQAIYDLVNGMKFGGPGSVGIPMPGCGPTPIYDKWKSAKGGPTSR